MCDSNIKVSVITVCFNSVATIERTIKSVYNQTYSNIEYIIVDGQSTDGTLGVIEEFRPLFGDRLSVISEPDKGIYDAMNKGILRANGTIIGLVNSDDYYETDAIEKVVDAYLEHHDNPLAVYYGADRAVKEGKEYSITFHNADYLKESMISHPASFVTKAAYDELGLYDTQYSCVADYDLMLRYKQSGKVDFVPIYAVLSNFTLGGTCTTDKAQFDLLDLKVNYGMCSQRNANWIKFLNKSSKIFRKIVGNAL